MENQIVKLNPEQYGIQESKAKELEIIFAPFIEILKKLESERDKLMNKEITQELCYQAHEVKMKAVKFRTGIDKVHKQAKEETLKTGRAIDGWKNLLLNASAPIESDAGKIEKHFELLEAERIAKLQEERASQISKYGEENIRLDLGTMPEQVWNNFLTGTKSNYEAKIAAEKKAEEERIAAEKARVEEEKRIRAENERLRIEAEKKEKELEKERKKAEAERKKQEEILAKERAEAEARQKAIEEKARIEKEKAETEKRKLEAELQAKKDAELKEKQRIEAEEKARKEAEKKAAMASDKEKLTLWINSISISKPTNLRLESMQVATDIFDKFESFKKWALQQIELL